MPRDNDDEVWTTSHHDNFSVNKRIPTDLPEALPNAGVPRASYTASREKPDQPDVTTPYVKPGRQTTLQKHVSYFDRNKDGVIHLHETFMGFRALGFTTLLALSSALAFHILHVSYPTSHTWIPDLRFPVYVKNIHWAKHGSDTESFDTEGRFVPQKFEEIFSKYDSDDKGGLYFTDLVNMWRGNRGVLDVVGWVFQLFLWTFLFALAARRPGPEESGDRNREVLWKQDVVAQYDGSLYYEIEARRKKGQCLPWYRGGQWFGII